ncbi:DUF6660 family protein [Epilithonimonas tenax]|uniref:DUF6660 family protein n=1 Tax=Epilithonimonas tenax TaxID=191577 RepID=UPI00373FD5A8
MKILRLILTFYFLALSVMPCTDACGMNTNTTSKKNEFVRRANNQTKSNDICSPFCTCSHCNTPVHLTFDVFALKVKKPIINPLLKFPVRELSFISNFYGNIWQPPKLTV